MVGETPPSKHLKIILVTKYLQVMKDGNCTEKLEWGGGRNAPIK